jgi:hypothetical protein
VSCPWKSQHLLLTQKNIKRKRQIVKFRLMSRKSVRKKSPSSSSQEERNMWKILKILIILMHVSFTMLMMMVEVECNKTQYFTQLCHSHPQFPIKIMDECQVSFKSNFSNHFKRRVYPSFSPNKCEMRIKKKEEVKSMKINLKSREM